MNVKKNPNLVKKTMFRDLYIGSNFEYKHDIWLKGIFIGSGKPKGINLETGEIRDIGGDTLVLPVFAEVSYSNYC